MRYALELCFDSESDALIRSLWTRLRAEGLFTPDRLDFAPHLTLAVCSELNDAVGCEVIDEVTRQPVSGSELVFRGIDTFRTEPGVVFLGVGATPWLAALQRRAWELLNDSEVSISAYYHPDMWTPHVSLAERLCPEDLARGLSTLSEVPLPTHAQVSAVRLISLPPAQVLYSRAWV